MTDIDRIADYWDELVTVALLGTDRRDPPEMPTDRLADVVADALAPSPAERMLIAGRRRRRRSAAAAFVPRVRAAPLPPPDGRPATGVSAGGHATRGSTIVADVAGARGRVDAHAHRARLAGRPQIVPAMLRRHRTDAVRRAHAGDRRPDRSPTWLAEHVESLRRATAAARPPRERIGVLPVLPVPPDLAELARRAGRADRRRCSPMHSLTGALGTSHRTCSSTSLARVAPDRLGAIADELERVSPAARRPTGSPPRSPIWPAPDAPCSTNWGHR